MSSLSSKVIEGSKWMLLLRLLSRSASIISSLILANILTPKDFGLVAVGMIVVSLLETFSEFGIKQSLIYESQENTSSFLDSAWSIELIRGICITVIIFLSSELISDFFNKKNANEIIKALAFIPLIKGLTSIRIIYFQKDIKFKKQFIYDISNLVGPFLVAIPLAFVLKNAWAIVFGTLVGAIFQMLISYYIAPYSPNFSLRFTHFAKMFRYGKWILVSSIVSYVAMELDTFVAARVFDASLLGVYTIGFTLANKPIIEVGKAITKVIFPAIAKIKDDVSRAKKAYLKSSLVYYILIIPLPILLFFTINDIEIIFLNNKWEGISEIIKILSIGTLFRALTVPSTSFLNGIGKPNYVFIIAFSRAIALVLPMVIFYSELDLNLLAYCVLFSNLIVLIIYLCFLKITLFSFKELLQRYNLLTMIILGVSITLVPIEYIFSEGILRLLIYIAVFGTIYILLILRLIRIENKSVLQLIMSK